MSPVTTAPVRELTIPAIDGFPLAACLFGDDSAESIVLIAPATGVRQRLYRAYAGFLAARGHRVVTWDWRGTGRSRPTSLRGFEATMRDWGERDLGGVIAWTSEQPGAARLAVVGHSFGGQALGLAPNAGHIARAVTIASQSGYFGHWPLRWQLAYAPLWHLVVPAVTTLVGYFPSNWFGLGEPLPRGVALQWARWCRRAEYLGDYSGHRSFTAPLLALSFTDDPIASLASVEALHAYFGSRPLERRHVAPREIGVQTVGHFGFFREGVAPTLWEETALWLERPASAERAAVTEPTPGPEPVAGTEPADRNQPP